MFRNYKLFKLDILKRYIDDLNTKVSNEKISVQSSTVSTIIYMQNIKYLTNGRLSEQIGFWTVGF